MKENNPSIAKQITDMVKSRKSPLTEEVAFKLPKFQARLMITELKARVASMEADLTNNASCASVRAIMCGDIELLKEVINALEEQGV